MDITIDATINSILGKENEDREVDKLVVEMVAENNLAADKVIQDLSKTADEADVEISDSFNTYEAARSLINERSMYRHQLNRLSKITASLNHLRGIKKHVKEILFPENLQ